MFLKHNDYQTNKVEIPIANKKTKSPRK